MLTAKRGEQSEFQAVSQREEKRKNEKKVYAATCNRLFWKFTNS